MFFFFNPYSGWSYIIAEISSNRNIPLYAKKIVCLLFK